MPKLVPISCKELLKILLKLGFQVIRTQGSHHFLKNSKGLTTVIPIHNNEEVGTGLLKKILRDAQISTQEFEIIRS